MSDWQPEQHDPRRQPEWQRRGHPESVPPLTSMPPTAQESQGWPQQWQQAPPPQGWQQPYQQYQPYQYQQQYVQPPVQVNVQQYAYGPARAVTQRSMGPGWVIFHLIMTFSTCGLWGFVWYAHARSLRSVTRYY